MTIKSANADYGRGNSATPPNGSASLVHRQEFLAVSAMRPGRRSMSGERNTSTRNSVASTGSRPSVTSDRGDALPKIPTGNLAGMGGNPPLVPRPPQGSRPVKPDAPRGGTPNSRN